MLTLAFEGWAQCRLATDPDPSDEPRGVSGWTFAVAGEPDLDRIIRFQPEGATPRSFCPPIGVLVKSVALDNRLQDPSPLVGATVDLLDDPVFDGRNGLGHDDAQEPIVPFHLRVGDDGVAIDRAHTDQGRSPIATPPAVYEPLQSDVLARFGLASPEERSQYRTERAAKVRAALPSAATPTEREALNKRLEDLETIGGPAIALLGMHVVYKIELRGKPAVVEDPKRLLGIRVDTRAAWTVTLSVGIWDADALSAFIEGALRLPGKNE